MSLARFSFNQATAQRWPLPDVVAGCVAAGVPGIGLWREPVAEYGLARSAKLVRDAGLAVTSLCRGGFFSADDWRAVNLRAIEEAAALGAPELVLVSGGLAAGSRDVDGARRRVADAIGELAPHAEAAGVRLDIEPLHPMFAADRCVIATLGQALDIAERFDPAVVGVVVDAYHVWWDDTVYAQIARAAARIAAFQVCDWVTPLPEGVLLGRALPGDGCIELRRLREAVDAAGYVGPIEVEVFSAEVWARPGAEVLDAAIAGYLRHVV
ncbi:sugar phosphate isomerase/epimerase [Micromonospora sp. D93]|uniref:sugar phosphate isomerase/epimerase family protein n=1 Tax=Micromonospora sp. D93 TaxID=2824886 RepID=UPI001B37BBF5|nr:sugar phosphate isomerase/epimerase family protein [Micromonospora sp. D93]MBQ1019645.1 sugar phosphate isomerase/epimerase [Micromonospora sp. D93]